MVCDKLACLFSSPVTLLLEVTPLPLGQPPLGIRLGPRVGRVKALGQPRFSLPLLLLPVCPTGQVCLRGPFLGSPDILSAPCSRMRVCVKGWE